MAAKSMVGLVAIGVIGVAVFTGCAQPVVEESQMSDSALSGPGLQDGRLPISQAQLGVGASLTVVAGGLNCRAGAGPWNPTVAQFRKGDTLVVMPSSDGRPTLASTPGGQLWVLVAKGGFPTATAPACYVAADTRWVAPAGSAGFPGIPGFPSTPGFPGTPTPAAQLPAQFSGTWCNDVSVLGFPDGEYRLADSAATSCPGVGGNLIVRPDTLFIDGQSCVVVRSTPVENGNVLVASNCNGAARNFIMSLDLVFAQASTSSIAIVGSAAALPAQFAGDWCNDPSHPERIDTFVTSTVGACTHPFSVRTDGFGPAPSCRVLRADITSTSDFLVSCQETSQRFALSLRLSMHETDRQF